MAKVFIVMTTKNRVGLLPRAVDSVLSQTFKDWELLIIDDNSTDKTRVWLDSNILDPRIQVISNIIGHNHSIVKQNYMLASVNEYLAVLDDDDFWRPDFLMYCVRSLEANFMTPFVFTDCYLIHEKGRMELENTLRGYPFPDILPSLCLFRRSAFKELKGWDLDKYKFGDKFIHAEIDYYLRARILYGEPQHINMPLVCITRSKDSMGASRELNLFGIKRLMFLWSEYLKQDRKVWSILNSRAGIHEIENGLSGIDSFKEALRYNPSNIEARGALVLSNINLRLFLVCYSIYRKLMRRH